MHYSNGIYTQKEFADDEYMITTGKAFYLDTNKKLEKEIEELQAKTEKAILSVRKEMNDHVSMFYAPSGNMIDEDTVKLLNSGIKLSSDEVLALVERHTNNPTMIRLVDDYCEKNAIENHTVKALGVMARQNGSEEMNIFDQSANLVMKAVSSNPFEAKTWGEAKNGNFSKIHSEQIEVMNRMRIKPEEVEEN